MDSIPTDVLSFRLRSSILTVLVVFGLLAGCYSSRWEKFDETMKSQIGIKNKDSILFSGVRPSKKAGVARRLGLHHSASALSVGKTYRAFAPSPGRVGLSPRFSCHTMYYNCQFNARWSHLDQRRFSFPELPAGVRLVQSRSGSLK